MSKDTRNSVSICGARLKKVMEKELSVLGATGLEVLFEEMHLQGFRFHQDNTYTMEQLHAFLQSILGEDGAALIVGRIASAIGRPQEDT